MDTNIEIFISLMDGIYWEGYTQQLAKENPAKFRFELDEFLTNHN